MIGAAVRLKPVEYVELFGPPAQRCSGCDHKKPDEHDAGGRLDQLVLADIARWSSWNRDSWGEGAWPSVPMIAARLGYCDRSVQYAMRRLERSGFIERVERAGFSSLFRIVRVVEPVDERAAVVDMAVHRRRRSRRSNTPPLHRRGATVAPERGYLPRDQAPVAPDRGLDKSDGAGAPAQPAPQWRRDTPGALAGHPPSSAGLVAKAHRSDASGEPGAGAHPPSLAVAGSALDDLGDVGEGDPLRQADVAAVRWSRVVTRQQPCPRCGAGPGEACRNRAGRLRKANHADRRTFPPPRLG